MPTQRPLIHLLCSADHNLLQRAAVSHSSGRPLAATDRLVRALTTLHRLALSPGPSAHPTVSSLFSLLGAAIHGMHAWTTLDDICRPFRLASDTDRHCPVAATGVEPGTARTFSMCTCGVRGAGTLDRCPGGVLRSIGQSAAPCQKQTGTFRGASWYVSCRHTSAQIRCSHP